MKCRDAGLTRGHKIFPRFPAPANTFSKGNTNGSVAVVVVGWWAVAVALALVAVGAWGVGGGSVGWRERWVAVAVAGGGGEGGAAAAVVVVLRRSSSCRHHRCPLLPARTENLRVLSVFMKYSSRHRAYSWAPSKRTCHFKL